MVQDHQEHPTLEQLSAYLDGALSSEEHAFCASHVPHCPSCRSELASLGLTRDLLRALPRATPPRTFTLTPELLSASFPPERSKPAESEKASAAEAPTTPLVSSAPPARRRPPQSTAGARARRQHVRRAVQVISALAAVIALALLLSGLLPALRGNFSTSISPAAQRPMEMAPHAATPTIIAATEQPQGADRSPQVAAGHTGPQPSLTSPAGSAGTPPAQQAHQLRPTSPGPAVSFDLATPEMRLLLGGLLFAVSLASLLMTRRARSSP